MERKDELKLRVIELEAIPANNGRPYSVWWAMITKGKETIGDVRSDTLLQAIRHLIGEHPDVFLVSKKLAARIKR